MLHVVHGYRPVGLGEAALAASSGSVSVDVEGVNRAIEDNAQSVCAHAASAAERTGAKVETHVTSGDAADAIINVAQQVSADLIVVGNRGMTSAKRFVLGSVPNRISHHAPCSVLIVDTRA